MTTPPPPIPDDLELSGAQQVALADALLDAFPTQASLTRLVRAGLGPEVAAQLSESSRAEFVDSLLAWADARDETRRLLLYALAQNSSNHRLRALALAVGVPPPPLPPMPEPLAGGAAGGISPRMLALGGASIGVALLLLVLLPGLVRSLAPATPTATVPPIVVPTSTRDVTALLPVPSATPIPSTRLAVLPLPATNTPPPTNTPLPTATPAPQGRIAFTSRRDGTSADHNDEIYVMNADGTGVTRLTTSPRDDYRPSWSPDGRRIAFASYREDRHGIYVMDADGTGVRLVTTVTPNEVSLAWSPDGVSIAFTEQRNGNYDIWSVNADGADLNRRQLTNNPADDIDPAWSPDSRRLLFTSKRDGDDEIYVMNADGSQARNLSEKPVADDFFPAWAPDGRRIAFTSRPVGTRDTANEIFVMDADGNNRRRLSTAGGSDNGPIWSLDSYYIAFFSLRSPDNFDLYLMTSDGNGLRSLTTHPAWDFLLSWTGAP